MSRPGGRAGYLAVWRGDVGGKHLEDKDVNGKHLRSPFHLTVGDLGTRLVSDVFGPKSKYLQGSSISPPGIQTGLNRPNLSLASNLISL